MTEKVEDILKDLSTEKPEDIRPIEVIRAAKASEQNSERLAAQGKIIEQSNIKVTGYAMYDPLKVVNPEVGKQYRFGSLNDQIRARRIEQGWVDSKDKKGDPINIGDLRQMEMPVRQHEETIEKPRREKALKRLRSVRDDFHNEGAKAGVDTFGDIKLDR
jgi:hypothetical protein